MQNLLTPFQEYQILSLFPPGSTIVDAVYFRNEYLPCPTRISVELPDHSLRVVVLRVVWHRDASLAREAGLLPVLLNVELPVPEVLLAPQQDPDQPDTQPFAVYSFLNGVNCQSLAEQSAKGSQTAITLVIAAAERLAQMTERIKLSAVSREIPEISLLDELQSLLVEENEWLAQPSVLRAVEKLQSKLGKVESPLVFTNGDYQPANFLSDGEKVTGFVDFEHACFQDFLHGFVKYPIYDMRPLNKAGIVAYLLEKCGVSEEDFALRLVLGCLKTLRREIPMAERNSPYCQHIFGLLERSMAMVGKE